MLCLVYEPTITNVITKWLRRKQIYKTTCRRRCWSAFWCKLEAPKTFRRYDEEQSLRNLAHEDPRSQRGPTIAERTDCRCNVSQHSPENQEIQESARTARKRSEDEAMTIPTSVHLLQGQTRLRLGSTMVAKCGKDWWQTKLSVKMNIYESFYRSKYTTNHLNCFRINCLGDDPSVVVDKLDHLL